MDGGGAVKLDEPLVGCGLAESISDGLRLRPDGADRWHGEGGAPPAAWI